MPGCLLTIVSVYWCRFFNDLLSIGVQPDFGGAFWHTMRVFYDGDTYPALGLYFRFPDVVVSFPILQDGLF